MNEEEIQKQISSLQLVLDGMRNGDGHRIKRWYISRLISALDQFPFSTCLDYEDRPLDINFVAFYDRMKKVLEIPIITKEHKSIWNEMGNLNPSLYCLQTCFKRNLDESWSFYCYGISKDVIGILGYGRAKTKDSAEGRAFQLMFACMLLRQNQEIDENTLKNLLVMAGIEPNPGPDTYDGTWSHAHNFDPKERFKISIKSEIFREDLRCQNLDFNSIFEMLMEEGSPIFQNVRRIPETNFYLIPKNLIFIYFNKKHITPIGATYEVQTQMVNSIKKQVMSEEQLVQTAYLMTVTAMMGMYPTNDVNNTVNRFRTIFADKINFLSEMKKMTIIEPYSILKNSIKFVLLPCLNFNPARGQNMKLSGTISLENMRKMQDDEFEEDEYTISEKGQYDGYGNLELFDKHFAREKELMMHGIYLPHKYMKNLIMQAKTSEVNQHRFSKQALDEVTFLDKFQLDLFKILIKETNLNIIKFHFIKLFKKYHRKNLLDNVYVDGSKGLLLFDAELAFIKIFKFIPQFPHRIGIVKAFQKLNKEKLSMMDETMSEHQIEDYIIKNANDAFHFFKIIQFNIDSWFKIIDIHYDTHLFLKTGIFREFKHYLLFEYKAERPITVAFDDSWNEEKDEEQLGLVNLIKSPFVGLKNFWLNTKETVNSVKNVSDKINEIVDDFSQRMESTGMLNVSRSVMSFDTSSIATTFLSVKNMFNAVLSDILNKFCNIFGFNYEGNLTTDQILLGYLLMNNTNDVKIKFIVMMDIATSLGITDAIWSCIKLLFMKFKGMFEAPTNVSFDDYMEDLERENDVIKKDGIEKTKKIAEGINEKEVIEEPGFLEDIWKKISDGCPKVLAVLATTLALAVGIKSIPKGKTLEEKISGGLRAFSFITLGAMAIPRMYKGILYVFNLVTDWMKEKWDSEHKSEVTILQEMKNWLSSVYYDANVSPLIAVSDLAYVLQYQKDYVQMLKYKRYRSLLEMNDRSAFDHLEKTMSGLYTTMETAFTYATGQMEPISITLYSKTPGVGKTDLKDMCTKTVMNTFRHSTEDVLKSMDLFTGPLFTMNEITYNITEGSKHWDGLTSQLVIANDEANVSKTMNVDEYNNKLKMLSGTPNHVPMADLNSKGKINKTYLYIENTNTPFPKFDGIYNMEAYYRRRILIEVSVNPKYLNKDGKIDDTKVTVEQRTQGKHLLCTILIPTDENKVPLDPNLVNLTAEELQRYLKSVTEKHFFVESKRLMAKTGKFAYLRMANISWCQQMVSMMQAMNAKDPRFQKLAAILKNNEERIRKLNEHDREQLLEYTDEEADLSKEVFEILQAMADKHLQNGEVEQLGQTNLRRLKETPELNMFLENFPIQIRKQYGKIMSQVLSEVPLQQIVGANLLVVKELTEFMKQVKDKYDEEFPELIPVADDGSYTYFKVRYDDQRKTYSLVKSKERQPVQEGPLNYKYFGIYVGEDGKDKHLEYKSEKLSPEYEKILLWHFLNIRSQGTSRAEIVNALKTGMKKYKAHKESCILIKKWREFKNVINETVKSISGYSWSSLLKEASGLFMKAVIITMGVAFAFTSIGAMATLLAPKEIGYNERKSGIKNLLPPMNIGNTKDDYGDLINIIKRNTYDIKISYKEGPIIRTKMGTAFGLKSDLLMTASHVVPNFDGDLTVELYDSIKAAFAPLDAVKSGSIRCDRHVVRIPNSDAAIIHFPGFRMSKDITHFFMQEADLGRNCLNLHSITASGVIIDTKREGDFVTRERQYKTVGECDATVTEKYDELWDTTSRAKRVVILNSSHNLYVTNGYSGSLYFHCNSKLRSHCLIGPLISTQNDITNRHFANIITREEIDVALKRLKDPSGFVVEELDLPTAPDNHPIRQIKEVCVELYESPFPNQSIREDPGFARSPMPNIWNNTIQPAIMHEKDKRIPPNSRHFLKVSINKYDNYKLPFLTYTEQTDSIKFLKRMIKKFYPHVENIPILTTREAIIGTKVPGSKPINIHTSAGIPYKFEKGAVGKQNYIRWNEHNLQYDIKPSVYEFVRMMENNYENNKLGLNYKLEIMKKELVGENKIIEPKTRTVATGTFVHQILYNKFNGSFKTFVSHTPQVYSKVGPYALGIDMEKDADKIVKHMRFPDYMMDFDVKAWERNVTYEGFSIYIEVILYFLKRAASKNGWQFEEHKNRKIMYGLMVDYIDSYVVFKDVVMRKYGGMLSGHPGTLIENSTVHIVYLFTIVNRILKQNHSPYYNNCDYILEHVRFMMAADDILIAVSPQAREIINVANIVKGYADLNLQVTAPDKSEKISKRTIHDVQFLKHKFKKVVDKDGKESWVASCLLEIPQSLLLWYRTDTKLTAKEQLLTNVETAFRFLYFHGPKVYEDYRESWNQFAQQHGMIHEMTFDEMAALIKHSHSKDAALQERSNELFEAEEQDSWF